MKTKSFLALTFLGTLLAGCSSKTYDKTVQQVDRDKFMGTWYVQAGRFTMFEKEVYNSVEKYSWNEKKQQIDIDFAYNKGALDGPVKKIPQTAWIENTTTNAHWKVQPIWPIKADYLIIALAADYTWTAIGVPNQAYLWVMTREAQFPRTKVDEILKELDLLGYSTKEIVFVEHSKK